MRADPLIPGKAYRVHHGKIVVDVIATNPCDAILIIANIKGMIIEYIDENDLIERNEDGSKA
jgi:hypothetical protein